jgi:NADPH-dependent 2,4-dienoyl-CoA reductase/sulfur reductase-like enzyme
LKIIVTAACRRAESRVACHPHTPQADVTVIEQGHLLSYAGCGLPYYVSGVVKEQRELMSTPVGVVRDPVFFGKVKNVKVRNATVALRIDRAKKRVGVAPAGGTEPTEWLAYDKLVLCTGARPVKPPLPAWTSAASTRCTRWRTPKGSRRRSPRPVPKMW